MGYLTDILIRRLHGRAIRRVGQLAAELVETPSEDKGTVLAELEFEQWRAEYCAACIEDR